MIGSAAGRQQVITSDGPVERRRAPQCSNELNPDAGKDIHRRAAMETRCHITAKYLNYKKTWTSEATVIMPKMFI